MEDLYHVYKEDDRSSEYVSEGEVSLNAIQRKCYKCGKTGHRPNKYCSIVKATWNYYSIRGTVKFKGEWHKCGKRGHYCQNFWELKNNASSFHRVWKLSYEAYNTSTNTQSKENDTPKFRIMIIDGVDNEDMVLAAQ